MRQAKKRKVWLKYLLYNARALLAREAGDDDKDDEMLDKLDRLWHNEMDDEMRTAANTISDIYNRYS